MGTTVDFPFEYRKRIVYHLSNYILSVDLYASASYRVISVSRNFESTEAVEIKHKVLWYGGYLSTQEFILFS